MEIGILQPYNEDEVKQAMQDNKRVVLGVELLSLYNDINLLEVNYQYQTHMVLAKLKYDILVSLGITKPQPQDTQDKEEGKQ